MSTDISGKPARKKRVRDDGRVREGNGREDEHDYVNERPRRRRRSGSQETQRDLVIQRAIVRACAVCLTLLFLLMAVRTVDKTIDYHSANRHSAEPKTDTNLTLNINPPKTNCDALTQENAQLKTEKNQLKTNYDTVMQENAQLKTEKNHLKTNYDTVMQENAQLKTEKNQLKTNYDTVMQENAQLKTEKNQLKTNYDTVMQENAQLKTEKNQLKTNCDALTQENAQLTTNYDAVMQEKDQLRTEKNLLENEKSCPRAWKKFGCSCYYYISVGKTWQQSREACLNLGADLVVINSGEEKEFILGLSPGTPHTSWIGLTRTGGTWTWVDGTPLTTTQYWESGYPSKREGWNCALYYHSGTGTLSTWVCSGTRFAICEK